MSPFEVAHLIMQSFFENIYVIYFQMFLCPFVSLFICLYNIYASSHNHVFIKTKKVVGIWKMDIYFCPKTIFPEKNLAKNPLFSFLPERAVNSDFFIENYHCNLFLGNFGLVYFPTI